MPNSFTGIQAAAKFLNYYFNGGAAFAPASFDFRLFVSGLTSAGTGGATEVSGTGYVAKNVARTIANFGTTATNQISNAAVIAWATAGAGGWTQAAQIGVFEVGGNNLVVGGTLDLAKTAAANDVIEFDIGAFIVTQS
jgi:hypothetical protein